ncbi:citrate synthase [Blattabacterium cuenoti]|uniref:citrate synthase n=1 Tax=Blattabacterium cuenoti TaxID=1653831 RepID=UPI00163CFBCD|nr:citrate synthase [Blattabacterium cuenoti]
MCSIVNFDINGYCYKLPLINGTFDKAIDISQLRENTRLITFDPGLKNTGITKSSISFINGEKGELLYRGYPIDQVIRKCSFIEASYLILNGELPNKDQLKLFSKNIYDLYFIEDKIYKILDNIPKYYHPMGMLSSIVNILFAFMNNVLSSNNENLYYHLLAKFPILIASIYRKKLGLSICNYDYDYNKKLYYTHNLLNMFFSSSDKFCNKKSIITNALDKLLILHIDHEQNCSTTTVRLLGSAHSNLLSAISAGINALWGRLHGGANQAVIEMLEFILKDGGNIYKWINKAKDKKNPFRLMGFGHRIYKNFDPRAKIAKNVAEDLIKELNISNNPILEIAKELENNALKDSYFLEKKLYPNIDFYSGIIYKIIGIPKDMYTVMFALGRLPGWMAHWKEMKKNMDPIGRPRQIYIGYKKRNIN